MRPTVIHHPVRLKLVRLVKPHAIIGCAVIRQLGSRAGLTGVTITTKSPTFNIRTCVLHFLGVAIYVSLQKSCSQYMQFIVANVRSNLYPDDDQLAFASARPFSSFEAPTKHHSFDHVISNPYQRLEKQRAPPLYTFITPYRLI